MASYFISERAEQDLILLVEHLEAAFGPAVAIQKLNRIETLFDRLARHPELGRRRNDLMKGLRSFAIRPNVVVYRLLNNRTVEILRVIDGRQELESIFDDNQADQP